MSISSVIVAAADARNARVTPAPPTAHWQNRPPTPWATQAGQLTFVLFSRVGRLLWFVVLVCYLYGDLTVYAVFVPDTLMRVFPRIEIGGHIVAQCTGVYWIGLIIFSICMVPFVFFPFRKTVTLQIITGIQRHVVFWTISIWALALALRSTSPDGGPKVEPTEHEKGFNWEHGPALLFGNAVYAFICQQYICALVSPMKRKRHTTKMTAIVLSSVLAYYLLMCWSTLYAFPEALKKANNDLVTFVFQNLQPRWLAKLVLAVPLLGVCTNYPLIAVVLRDNLIILWRLFQDRGHGMGPRDRSGMSAASAGQQLLGVGRGSSEVLDVPGRSSLTGIEQEISVEAGLVTGDGKATTKEKVVVGLIAALPSLFIAASRANVSALIALAGGYGGCMIMFVFPALLVHSARQTLDSRADLPPKELNPHRSPLSHPAWIAFVLLWAAGCLIIITHQFVANGVGGSDAPPCTPVH